jgi:phospholipase C
MQDAASTCPGFSPTGRYPDWCPAFDQYGFRVPFIAVSAFAKPQYVSHTLGDHTSLVALVEKRFMPRVHRGRHPPALTSRDRRANTLEDMFDFDHAPSRDAVIPDAPPSSSSDEGCQ